MQRSACGAAAEHATLFARRGASNAMRCLSSPGAGNSAEDLEMSGPSVPTTIAFEGVTPILSVRDLRASIDYYVRILGFALDWESPGGFASVSRGRCGIFLAEGDQGHPGAWVWVGVGDVEALFEEYARTGAKIRQAPTNFDWACEMQVEDLDGNVLRMGSDSKAGQPFGEWLDMRGSRWVKSPEGKWSRVGGT